MIFFSDSGISTLQSFLRIILAEVSYVLVFNLRSLEVFFRKKGREYSTRSSFRTCFSGSLSDIKMNHDLRSLEMTLKQFLQPKS